MDLIMQQKNRINLLLIIACLVGIISVIFSQKNSSYLNLSKSVTSTPSKFLASKLTSVSTPIKITIFASKELSNELDLDLLTRWIESISPFMTTAFYDTSLNPDKADHFDIATDGVIVIEFDGKRRDIDLIEQIILNEGHSIANIQNILTRTLLQLTQKSQPTVLIIHSSSYSLLENTDPLGLQVFKQITDFNFLSIKELHVNELRKLNQKYDLIIFYKLGQITQDQRTQLKQLYDETSSVIIFNHPKFSPAINDIILADNIQFSSRIVEDDAHHLIRSKNQLIINYTSKLNQSLIGVFPFTGFIDHESSPEIKTLAASGEDSYFKLNSTAVPGPFSIIIQRNDNKRTYINNYLLATNFWLTQGDNQFIVEDILQSHLDDFPIISSPDIHQSNIVLTRHSIITFLLQLIILPIVLYILIGFIYLKRSKV